MTKGNLPLYSKDLSEGANAGLSIDSRLIMQMMFGNRFDYIVDWPITVWTSERLSWKYSIIDQW